MACITNWSFCVKECIDGKYVSLLGNVSDHPKLADGIELEYSSPLQDIIIDTDQKAILFQTKNTLYHSTFAAYAGELEIDIDIIHDILNKPSVIKFFDDLLNPKSDLSVLIASEREAVAQEKLKNIEHWQKKLGKKEIYVSVGSDRHYYFNYAVTQSVIIECPYVYLGMYHDTVLINFVDREFLAGFDLRYLPFTERKVAFYKDFSLVESGYADAIYIENAGKQDLQVEFTTGATFTIKPHEVIRATPKI